MSTPVDLNLETDSGYLFVSGTWFLGELRLDFDELSYFIKEENYESIVVNDSDTWCYSCHRRPKETDQNIDLEELSGHGTGHDIIICNECKDLFKLHIEEFINNNSCEVSIQSL